VTGTSPRTYRIGGTMRLVSLTQRTSMSKAFASVLLAITAWPAFSQVSPAGSGPSFDCSKSRGRIEKQICADAGLSALDRRVAELIEVAQSQTADQGSLKRAQRRWLSDRDDCEDAQCLNNSYETRIAELGDLTGRFTHEFSNALCQPFSDAQKRTELLANSLGTEDINNDREPERASSCSGGTANVPCVAYSSADGKPLAIQPDGFEWMTYGAFGRKPFRFENRTFTFYAHDAALERPAFISYVTPTNREVRVCDFETQITSAVLEGGADVCAALEIGDARIENVELPANRDLKLLEDRPDTQPRALGKIDIDNDGFEENVLELILSSGAGKGCEYNYFELLSEDSTTLANNSNAQRVRELQDIGATGVNVRNCGLVENRLLRFNDRIYLEKNAKHASDLPHELRILQGDAVINVCTFERQVRSRVKTLY